MLVVRNPTTRCPAAVLRPLSALPPPPPRPPLQPLPVLLSRASVRPATATPVHSPSFLMLGSYSRCAERELSLSPPVSLPLAVRLSPPPPPPLSLSLPLSPERATRAPRSPSVPRVSRSLSLSLSLPLSFPLPPAPTVPSRSLSRARSRALSQKKKRRGLRSIFITQTGRPSGAHKKCLFTYGDWSATGFGGNAEPLSLSPAAPSRPAPRRRRLFPARVLRFSCRPPRALSCTPLSLSPFPPFFSTRGKNARRPSIGRGDR